MSVFVGKEGWVSLLGIGCPQKSKPRNVKYVRFEKKFESVCVREGGGWSELCVYLCETAHREEGEIMNVEIRNWGEDGGEMGGEMSKRMQVCGRAWCFLLYVCDNNKRHAHRGSGLYRYMCVCTCRLLLVGMDCICLASCATPFLPPPPRASFKFLHSSLTFSMTNARFDISFLLPLSNQRANNILAAALPMGTYTQTHRKHKGRRRFTLSSLFLCVS